MADNQSLTERLLVNDDGLEDEPNCELVLRVVRDDELEVAVVPCDDNDTSVIEHNEQNVNCQSDVEIVVERDLVLQRSRDMGYKIVKYLTILLLGLSLSFGIYMLVNNCGDKHINRYDYPNLWDFYKSIKEFVVSSQQSSDQHSFTYRKFTFEEPDPTPDEIIFEKIILIPKIVAQAVTSIVDLYGIIAVFAEHFYSVRDLVGFMSFLHLYLLFDFSQQFTPIRLVVESFAMIALIAFSQKIKPLHAIPLLPCTCDTAEFIKVLLMSILPCSCCSSQDIDRSAFGQKRRMEAFKLRIIAAILTSFGFSVYFFYSLYPQVDGQSCTIYVITLIINSIVSFYGLIATKSEKYRALNGHFSLSLTGATIILILALRLSTNAAWLLLPLATSALSIYVLTCLLRLLYAIKDSKPYAGCKTFLLFWQISTVSIAPAFMIVTYLHYTEQEKMPALIFCAASFIFLALQCSSLYGTLAEKFELLDWLIKPIFVYPAMCFGASLVVQLAVFKDITIPVMLYSLSYLLAVLPILPFLVYYNIELKLFYDVMTENEVWFIHRQARKVFETISISHTVGSFCSSGMHPT